jgi:hypothetical protein
VCLEKKAMDTPDGLHELQYARQVLEEVLGWPAKGNLELIVIVSARSAYRES